MHGKVAEILQYMRLCKKDLALSSCTPTNLLLICYM